MRHASRPSSANREQKNLGMESLEPRVLLAADLQAFNYEPIAILDPYTDQAVTVDQMMARAQEVAYVQGDLMVALQTPWSSKSVQNEFYLDTIRWGELTGVPTSFNSTLMQVDQPGGSFVLVQLDIGQADLFETMVGMEETPHVLWTSPNFYLEGNQQDFVPDDPGYGQQFTHPLVGSESAWDFTLGDSGIVVGITDDGVDLVHDDLAPNIWVNTGEIAGNGVDDDNNGYIDDIHGWDWANDNNDPGPNGGSHGTHVAGISAARTDNGIGVAGLSGHSTIMPLQFYGGVNGWTASIINNTFTYAADNGAHIVNTSYNINGWVGDPVFTAGMQYMYDNGVLHFNSAGNGSELNPARQAFEQTFLVVSTTSSDTKSGFSNYGTGVDISAPGSDVYSTLPGQSYGNNSGTSMAAPNAAGAAALIWSANPTWTPDQVVSQLLGTADNIDAQNPGYAGLLGAGRINVARALTETLAAPQIKSLTDVPTDGGTTTDLTIDSFAISFDQVMDPVTVNNLANYELREAGFDGTFETGDDSVLSISIPSPYLLSTNQLFFDVDNGPLPYGKYQITVDSGVQNPFGTPLDGNSDGTEGGSFVSTFTISPPPPASIQPQGSLIYEQSFPGNILSAVDVDQFGVSLDAGQTLTVVVQGAPGLVPVVNVYDPASQQVTSVTGNGSSVTTSVLDVDSDGSWMLEVKGDSGTTGNYQLTWLLNTNVELEGVGGVSNDTLATAQELDSSALDPGNGSGDRLAVIGTLPTSDGTPVVQDDFESGSLGSAWSTSSTATGRIQVTGQYGTSSGSFALVMDSSTDSSYSRNEAIWTVDLSGLTSPSLVFDHAEFSDEEDSLPLTYSGSVDGDGVSISDDGFNWYRILDPASLASGEWDHVVIDLDEAANNAGMTLGPDFQIKFQQYDNFTLTTDGRAFDNISINVPDIAADWYAFDLTDGQFATIAATAYQGSGSVLMELYDSAGNLLETGVGSNNVSGYISQFQDPTNNGSTDTWYVRVSGQDSGYSLLVTRNVEFDLEPNESGSPQDINNVDGVLGYVSSFSTELLEPDDYAVGTVLNNVLPGVTLSNAVGATDVVAEVATFGAPTGTIVFSPGPGSASGWSDAADELRVDFDNPTNFVSIDAGSDDSSDVGFLRAYNSAGTLLEEVISGSVSSGGSETLTINRASADIAYVIASGLGSDVTPLDNLVYGVFGTDDSYLIAGVAGQEIRYDAFLPGAGPLWFVNGLEGKAGRDLQLDLYEDFGAGSLVASGVDSIAYTPTQSGDYRLVVSSADGGGEYYLQRAFGQPDKFDFGPASAPVQAEWIGVQRDVYNPSSGYGWLGPNRALRLENLGRGNDLTGDAFQVAVGTFVVDVPNDEYEVIFHFGQTVHGDDVRIAVEGAAYSFTPQTGQVELIKATIDDGQLTINFDGQSGSDNFVRVAGIEIRERQGNFARNAVTPDNPFDSFADAFAMLPRSEKPIDSAIQTRQVLDSPAGNPVDLALQGMISELGSDQADWFIERESRTDLATEIAAERTGVLIDEVLKDPLAF